MKLNKLTKLVSAALLTCTLTNAYAGYFLYKPMGGLKPVGSGTTPPPTPLQCNTPWGTTLADKQSAIAYLIAQGTSEQPCVSQVRTCNNGVLSGTYTQQTCQAAPVYTYAQFLANPAIAANGYQINTALYGKFTTDYAISSGKHYLEINFVNFRPEVGITTQATNDTGQTLATYPLENKTNAAAMYVTTSLSNRFAYVSSTAATVASNNGTIASYDRGIIGIAIDADNNQVTYYNQNGAIGTLNIKLPKPWYFTIARGNSNSDGALNATINTGYAPFSLTPPSGFRKGLYH